MTQMLQEGRVTQDSAYRNRRCASARPRARPRSLSRRRFRGSPEGVCDSACAKWIVLRGPFGAPENEGGGLLKQALGLLRALVESVSTAQPQSILCDEALSE